MSLTSLLDDTHGPVRQWFQGWLPNVKPIQRSWKMAGTRTILGEGVPLLGQVGAALDYRIRLWFERFDINSTIAASGALNLYGSAAFSGECPFDTVVAALDAFLDDHDPCGRLLDAESERELAGFCFMLALYEVHFRNSIIRTAVLDLPAKPSKADFDAMVPGACIEDVYASLRVSPRPTARRRARRRRSSIRRSPYPQPWGVLMRT